MQSPQIPAELRDIFESLKKLVANNARGFVAQAPADAVAPETLSSTVLSTLISGDKNLNQVVRAIEIASGGLFKPSEGSVAAALEQLIEDRLVLAIVVEDRKVFQITEQGSVRIADLGQTPSSSEGAAEQRKSSDSSVRRSNIISATARFSNAVAGVAQSGTAEQKKRAAELVHEVTRKLYKILAED